MTLFQLVIDGLTPRAILRSGKIRFTLFYEWPEQINFKNKMIHYYRLSQRMDLKSMKKERQGIKEITAFFFSYFTPWTHVVQI